MHKKLHIKFNRRPCFFLNIETFCIIFTCRKSGINVKATDTVSYTGEPFGYIKRVNNSHLETSQFPIGRLPTLWRSSAQRSSMIARVISSTFGPRQVKPSNDRCGTANNREISIMSRYMKERGRLLTLIVGRLCSKRNTQQEFGLVADVAALISRSRRKGETASLLFVIYALNSGWLQTRRIFVRHLAWSLNRTLCSPSRAERQYICPLPEL